MLLGKSLFNVRTKRIPEVNGAKETSSCLTLKANGIHSYYCPAKKRFQDNIKMYRKWAGFSGTEWRPLAGSCQHGYVRSGSIKETEF
jgi:hypothetical protein